MNERKYLSIKPMIFLKQIKKDPFIIFEFFTKTFTAIQIGLIRKTIVPVPFSRIKLAKKWIVTISSFITSAIFSSEHPASSC